MATYLFTWNPAKWSWEDLEECIAEIHENGYFSDRWSCGVTKKIGNGDRAFLMRLGDEPRGIMAAGWVTSGFYERKHWDKQKAAKGKTALYVDINWDTLLNPELEIYSRTRLNKGLYSKMHWEPQASGVRIPDEVAEQLERDWAIFLNRPPINHRSLLLAEEIDASKTYTEGTTRQITVNVYERSPEARTICVNRYGLNCSVCGFNFEKTYGEVGKGFIQVHHLKPLAEIRKGHKLNPIKDLRPVCPNCHAMLHKRTPAYSIEELRDLLSK